MYTPTHFEGLIPYSFVTCFFCDLILMLILIDNLKHIFVYQDKAGNRQPQN